LPCKDRETRLPTNQTTIAKPVIQSNEGTMQARAQAELDESISGWCGSYRDGSIQGLAGGLIGLQCKNMSAPPQHFIEIMTEGVVEQAFVHVLQNCVRLEFCY
jgi:hypothetical protein